MKTSVISKTPMANRGLECQQQETITAQIHWIQGVALVRDYQEFINFITASTKGVPNIKLGKGLKKGCYWEHSAYSTCNSQFYFNDIDQFGYYRIGFSLSGSTCERMGVRNSYRLIRGLRCHYKAGFTRIDLKIRVSDKLISLDDVLESGKNMDFTGFRNPPSNVVSRKKNSDGSLKESITVYFGSRESDCFMRFYDPYECHGVEDSVDIETVFKDTKACEISDLFSELENGCDDTLIGQLIASLVVGQIKFIDRSGGKRASRCQMLIWWSNLLSLVGGHIKILGAKSIKSFEKFLGFLDRQVVAGLAALRSSRGMSYVMNLLRDLINNKVDFLSQDWLNLVEEDKLYGAFK